jgi:hypothetical protein
MLQALLPKNSKSPSRTVRGFSSFLDIIAGSALSVQLIIVLTAVVIFSMSMMIIDIDLQKSAVSSSSKNRNEKF